MNVELRHLRCLIAIVDTGSFTDAAIDLGISQAAVSRALASLESALGVRLLRRTSREVTLTAAGNRVLPHARRALAEAADVVREAAAGHTRLRIGSSAAFGGINSCRVAAGSSCLSSAPFLPPSPSRSNFPTSTPSSLLLSVRMIW